MKRTVLLSGFEPFGGDTRNPSREACALVHGELIGGHRVISVDLPVTFSGAWRRLEAAIRRHDPALVLATGLWAGRSDLSIERVALNHIDARIPDNAGRQPRDRPIIPGAPLAYAPRLPVGQIVATLRAAGIPATASLTAGAFVCNFLYYRLAHALQPSRRRYGFIHVPSDSNEQPKAQQGGLPLPIMAEGLRLIIAATLGR